MAFVNKKSSRQTNWDCDDVVILDDTIVDDDSNRKGNAFEVIEKDQDIDGAVEMEEDHDKPCSIDVWEHVQSSIHSVLLKEVWMATTVEEMIGALDRLWSSCISTKDTIESTNLLEDDTNYIRHDTEIEIFYTLGGYSIIVGIMNKYQNHDIIQEKCCLLLGVVCKNHPDMICHALYADVVRCIVRCMVKFPAIDKIQLNACFVLNTLSEHNNYDACTKIMGLLDEKDTDSSDNAITNHVTGLQMIILAMKTYPNNSLLQYYGCSLLYNLTFDDFLSDIRTVGAMGVLAAAMETHSSHIKIKEMARSAMMELL